MAKLSNKSKIVLAGTTILGTAALTSSIVGVILRDNLNNVLAKAQVDILKNNVEGDSEKDVFSIGSKSAVSYNSAKISFNIPSTLSGKLINLNYAASQSLNDSKATSATFSASSLFVPASSSSQVVSFYLEFLNANTVYSFNLNDSETSLLNGTFKTIERTNFSATSKLFSSVDLLIKNSTNLVGQTVVAKFSTTDKFDVTTISKSFTVENSAGTEAGQTVRVLSDGFLAATNYNVMLFDATGLIPLSGTQTVTTISNNYSLLASDLYGTKMGLDVVSSNDLSEKDELVISVLKQTNVGPFDFKNSALKNSVVFEAGRESNLIESVFLSNLEASTDYVVQLFKKSDTSFQFPLLVDNLVVNTGTELTATTSDVELTKAKITSSSANLILEYTLSSDTNWTSSKKLNIASTDAIAITGLTKNTSYKYRLLNSKNIVIPGELTFTTLNTLVNPLTFSNVESDASSNSVLASAQASIKSLLEENSSKTFTLKMIKASEYVATAVEATETTEAKAATDWNAVDKSQDLEYSRTTGTDYSPENFVISSLESDTEYKAILFHKDGTEAISEVFTFKTNPKINIATSHLGTKSYFVYDNISRFAGKTISLKIKKGIDGAFEYVDYLVPANLEGGHVFEKTGLELSTSADRKVYFYQLVIKGTTATDSTPATEATPDVELTMLYAFQTKTADATAISVAAKANTLTPTSNVLTFSNLESFNGKDVVFLYKPTSAADTVSYTASKPLHLSSEATQDLPLSGLEPGTEYKVNLAFAADRAQSVKLVNTDFTFTTKIQPIISSTSTKAISLDLSLTSLNSYVSTTVKLIRSKSEDMSSSTETSIALGESDNTKAQSITGLEADTQYYFVLKDANNNIIAKADFKTQAEPVLLSKTVYPTTVKFTLGKLDSIRGTSEKVKLKLVLVEKPSSGNADFAAAGKIEKEFDVTEDTQSVYVDNVKANKTYAYNLFKASDTANATKLISSTVEDVTTTNVLKPSNEDTTFISFVNSQKANINFAKADIEAHAGKKLKFVYRKTVFDENDTKNQWEEEITLPATPVSPDTYPELTPLELENIDKSSEKYYYEVLVEDGNQWVHLYGKKETADILSFNTVKPLNVVSTTVSKTDAKIKVSKFDLLEKELVKTNTTEANRSLSVKLIAVPKPATGAPDFATNPISSDVQELKENNKTDELTFTFEQSALKPNVTYSFQFVVVETPTVYRLDENGEFTSGRFVSLAASNGTVPGIKDVTLKLENLAPFASSSLTLKLYKKSELDTAVKTVAVAVSATDTAKSVLVDTLEQNTEYVAKIFESATSTNDLFVNEVTFTTVKQTELSGAIQKSGQQVDLYFSNLLPAYNNKVAIVEVTKKPEAEAKPASEAAATPSSTPSPVTPLVKEEMALTVSDTKQQSLAITLPSDASLSDTYVVKMYLKDDKDKTDVLLVATKEFTVLQSSQLKVSNKSTFTNKSETLASTITNKEKVSEKFDSSSSNSKYSSVEFVDNTETKTYISSNDEKGILFVTVKVKLSSSSEYVYITQQITGFKTVTTAAPAVAAVESD